MRRLTAGAVGAIALVVLGEAAAQPIPVRLPASQRSRSLRDRIGADAAQGLLREESSAARRRGIERLGSSGTPRALELLARALDPEGAARDARERLSAVRALAPHAADPIAEEALVRALGGVEGRVAEKDLLVERTAALALAASRTKSAWRALARALRQPGRVSEHAGLALGAHPPKSVLPLLEATGLPTPALVALLGELGAPSAIPLVEKALGQGGIELRAAALRALFRLDPARALAVARSGFTSETERELRVALGEVLVRGADPLAPRALALLLAEPTTRLAALDLALAHPSPALGPALAQAPGADGDERLLAALGRAGGKEALARLERSLTHASSAWPALYALALTPDDDADEVLERALTRRELRRDALRATALRATARGQSLDDAGEILAELARGDASDRAAVAWYRALLEPDSAASAVTGRDEPALRATLRTAATNPALAGAAAGRLATEADPSLSAALAVGLTLPSAADRVPTAKLVELLEAHGAASYLAAYALALRDSELLRPELRELLASDDPLLRAHVALGLGQSHDPTVVGLLGEAYRGEPDAGVRRAIVRALGLRSERARVASLELAATLEPDAVARESARVALGRSLGKASGRRATLWLRFEATPSVPSLALVTTSSGLAVPYAPDPDGSVIVTGLADGDVNVEIAAATPGRTRAGGGKP